MNTTVFSSPTQAHTAQPAHVSFQHVQIVLLWVMMASGFVVNIEPAPYEFLFVITACAFLAGGLRVSFALAPLVLFLGSYNIGGAFSVVPILHDTEARMFIIVSFYMATTSVFLAMAVLNSPEKIMATVRSGWIFASVFASINGIIGYFDVFGLGASWAPISRAQGLFKDPNVLSTFLIAPAIFLIQDIVVSKDRWSFVKIPILGLVLAALFLAFSRGAWINTIAAAGIVMGLHFLLTPSISVRSRIVLYAISGVLLTGIMIAVALSFEAVRDIFVQRFSLNQSYDVGETGRFGRQLKSLSELILLPNGMGPLQFGAKYGEDPHNVFLNAFASYGWLGGISYLMLIICTIMTGWRAVFTAGPLQHHSIAIYAVLVCTIFQGVQIDTDHWRHFYILLGLAWGLYAATVMYAGQWRTKSE